VTYDLIVIGSGPGGYSAAVRAGQYGLKTAIVEKDAKLGGTCLHVGCIPTKALLHTAELWSFANHSADEGITIEKPVLNYPKVIERKNGIVQKHAKGVEFLMKKNKVDWIPGFATIKSTGEIKKIEVKSDKGTQTLETKNILIATGSEVAPTLAAAQTLAERGTRVRAVSMPCMELFEAQPQEYREQVLPAAVRARLAVEAGATMSWWKWVGLDGDVLGLDRFGASAPGGTVLKELGFSVENILARAQALLESSH